MFINWGLLEPTNRQWQSNTVNPSFADTVFLHPKGCNGAGQAQPLQVAASPHGTQEAHGRLTTDYGQPSAALFLLPTAYRLLPTALYSPLLAMKVIKSLTRQEYPHSLSYQATTFTSVPSMTLVKPASIMDEFELPVKSTETNSSSTN